MPKLALGLAAASLFWGASFAAAGPVLDQLRAAAGPGPVVVAPRMLRVVDLSAQFPDDGRDQAALGVCSDFAAVALLEAAYFRETDRRVRLSEADLFTRSTVLSGQALDAFARTGALTHPEGGPILDLVLFGRDSGVASEPDYDVFRRRYERFKREDAFALWSLKMDRPEVRRAVRLMLEDKAPVTEQRLAVKSGLAGARVESERFALPSDFQSRARCASEGAGQRRLIDRALDGGRPVAVAVWLPGLPAWGRVTGPWHAIVLTGRGLEPDGSVSYATRNSWPGVHPPLREDELCRIGELVDLITPADAAR